MTNDAFTLGPQPVHVTPMTIAWLNKKDLVTTSDGEVYNASVDNSASHTSLPKDNAESNSSSIIFSITHSGANVNRNSLTAPISAERTQKNPRGGSRIFIGELLKARFALAQGGL